MNKNYSLIHHGIAIASKMKANELHSEFREIIRKQLNIERIYFKNVYLLEEECLASYLKN